MGAADRLTPGPVDTDGAGESDDVAAEYTRTISNIEASGVLDQ